MILECLVGVNVIVDTKEYLQGRVPYMYCTVPTLYIWLQVLYTTFIIHMVAVPVGTEEYLQDRVPTGTEHYLHFTYVTVGTKVYL